MKLTILKETTAGETRCALLPESVKKLVGQDLEVECEASLGTSVNVEDPAYTEAGATIFSDREQAIKNAECVACLNPLPEKEQALLAEGSTVISFLDPFDGPQTLQHYLERNVTALGMEFIPRSTYAQKMDAISSQANIAGYAAVLLAAEKTSKLFPMMMTPSGTIQPAKVFIIGAGVAGLQAIATARRLGARVEAFDTRPVVAEQVQSLGARFLHVDLGETGQTKDGYAKALTDEQIQKQREAMAKACAQADIVITTAQLFGRKAPTIITQDMVNGMKPGSIIIDLAASTGGNVEGIELDKDVSIHGVTLIGLSNFAGLYPAPASAMYSNNLAYFIEHVWDNETKTLALEKEDDEIIQGCTVTRGGKIVNEFLQSKFNPETN